MMHVLRYPTSEESAGVPAQGPQASVSRLSFRMAHDGDQSIEGAVDVTFGDRKCRLSSSKRNDTFSSIPLLLDLSLVSRGSRYEPQVRIPALSPSSISGGTIDRSSALTHRTEHGLTLGSSIPTQISMDADIKFELATSSNPRALMGRVRVTLGGPAAEAVRSFLGRDFELTEEVQIRTYRS